MEEKDMKIKQIKQNALQRVAELSIDFARAKSEDKEDILAKMEFQRFMAESCQLCLDG